MQVKAFVEDLQNGRKMDDGWSWYIITENCNILFSTGNYENFWKHSEKWGISIEDIDVIILPQGCHDSIRKLEFFLLNNNKGKVYIPKASNESYLHMLYDRLLTYSERSHLERLWQWKKRIVFGDEYMDIGNKIHIFSGMAKKTYETLQEHNMMLIEDGIGILFVNDDRNAAEFIQKKAEFISGRNINYIFYRGDHQECMKKNCMTCEQTRIMVGQTVLIDTEDG